MKISTEELQAFTAVVDCGSITAAAEQLGITVSGVSRSLGRLEGKLATTLMTRTTRRIELTEEGRTFLQHARTIIAAIDTAEEDMLVRGERPSGKLRIDAASPFMLHVVVPLVGAFRERFPAISLELTSNDHLIDLMKRRTDVAIRIGRLQDSTLHARPLGRTRLRLLATPAYIARAGLPENVASLADHACLGFVPPNALNQWPVATADGLNLSINPTIAASSGETLRQLALDGQGIACLADFMSLRDRQDGSLLEVLADDTLEVCQPVNAVYYRNTALSARIGCFLDFLAERLPGLI